MLLGNIIMNSMLYVFYVLFCNHNFYVSCVIFYFCPNFKRFCVPLYFVIVIFSMKTDFVVGMGFVSELCMSSTIINCCVIGIHMK